MADDKYKIVLREEARALGLKHYFTGEPCKRGHICKRYVSCTQCFECGAEHRKKWRSDNPERTNELHREWRKNNPEKERESHIKSNARWWEKTKDRWNKKRRDWWWANLEMARAKGRISSAAVRAKNPEKYRASSKRWRLKNPERWKVTQRRSTEAWVKRNPFGYRIRASVRRARKKNNGGNHTYNDIMDIFRLQRNRCAYCKIKLIIGKWHVDHIIPIVSGGRNDRRNLQILCEPCNLKKHAHDPIEFAQSLGKLL